jgi:hypothetical protein
LFSRYRQYFYVIKILSISGSIHIFKTSWITAGVLVYLCAIGTAVHGQQIVFNASGLPVLFDGWYPSFVHKKAIPLAGHSALAGYVLITSRCFAPGSVADDFPAFKVPSQNDIVTLASASRQADADADELTPVDEEAEP